MLIDNGRRRGRVDDADDDDVDDDAIPLLNSFSEPLSTVGKTSDFKVQRLWLCQKPFIHFPGFGRIVLIDNGRRRRRVDDDDDEDVDDDVIPLLNSFSEPVSTVGKTADFKVQRLWLCQKPNV